MNSKFFNLVMFCLSLVGVAPSWAGSAKILLYHHVASETPASTSVTPETFDAHLDLLEGSGYQVVKLQKIIDTLVSGAEFDSKWVAITFDDAYDSVLSEAAPRLHKRDWPFTVFVNTDLVGAGVYLNWDELRALEAAGASIANHTRSHQHMVRQQPGETKDAWLERLTREVIEAQARLESELDDPLRIFAYPFGEFTEEISLLMQSLGFIAFGQQSGPVGSTTNHYAIPRFPLATGFDSVDSLAEKLRTEHLPLVDPPVPASLLAADAESPVLTLQLENTGDQPGSLTCFVAGQPQAIVTWLDQNQVSVQAQRPLRGGRSKYTCTAPHPTIPRAYYWHTQLWIKPRADGSWYDG